MWRNGEFNGDRISFDIQPTVSLQIGTNQSSFAFQKGRCYWNEEMSEWQWLTCDYLFISSDCGIVRENIDVLLGSPWALCLHLFEIWLSEYPFTADNAECRMNECSRQGIVRKKKCLEYWDGQISTQQCHFWTFLWFMVKLALWIVDNIDNTARR